MNFRNVNRSNVSNFKVVAFAALAALGAGLAGCQDAANIATPEHEQHAENLLAMLESLRPDKAEIIRLVSDAQKSSGAEFAAAAGLAIASSPYVTAIELRPYLLDSDGNFVNITTETTAADLADGTLAIVPYEITYQDDTTSLTGFLDLRFIWNGAQNIFFPASPPQIISQAITASGAYVRGTAYNKMLDLLLDEISHNNGQLPYPEVLAIDSDGVVYSGASTADGSFEIGPLPVGKSYSISIHQVGFQSASSYIFISEAVLVEGFDLDVMPIISEMQQTGVVYGRVYDLDGDAAVNTAVRLIDGASRDPIAAVLGNLTNAAGEYALANLSLSSSVTYQTEGLYYSAVGYSSPFTIDSAAGQMIQRDIVIDNHKPTATCEGQAASGAAIAITVEVSSETMLTASASDLDDDMLNIRWTVPANGELYPQLVREQNVQSVIYIAPDFPTTLELKATVNDWISTRSCSILIDVVYPSN